MESLFLIVFNMQLMKGQTTYKYKMKWDLKKSTSTSCNVYLYVNTSDTYPFNGTHTNASSTSSNSGGSFSYVLKNSGVSPMDGVVVSNTPLRLSGAVDNGSSGFFQKHAPFLTGPYSSYWQSNFASNFDNVKVTHNTPLEFFYLQRLPEVNNYNVSNSELKQCETFNFSVAVVSESGSMTFAVEYYDPNSRSWKDLFPYASRSSQYILITFTSIPNQLNQNFQLRARYTGIGSGANDYSDILIYKFIPCSTKLNGPQVTAQVKCYNEPNRSVTLNFISNIPSDQKLLLTLYENSAYRSHRFAKDTDISNRAYIWDGLVPNSCMIKYQTQNASDPNATIGSRPVETPVLKIDNAEALTFKATAVQPQCSSDKGGIKISVSEGTPPYYYILDNEIKKELTKNPDIITVTTDGDHQVIIEDRFDCIEK